MWKDFLIAIGWLSNCCKAETEFRYGPSYKGQDDGLYCTECDKKVR